MQWLSFFSCRLRCRALFCCRILPGFSIPESLTLSALAYVLMAIHIQHIATFDYVNERYGKVCSSKTPSVVGGRREYVWFESKFVTQR